jgi:hypothetical protein
MPRGVLLPAVGWRVVRLVVIAVVGGLAAAGCHGTTGEKAGAAALFHLQTGECFQSPAGTTAGRTVQVADVSPVPCTGVHDGEVFAVLTHPAATGAAYPGDDALADFAAGECLQRFPAYTGGAYDDSDLDVASVRPDRQSWSDKHDRQVGCVLYKKDSTLTGSRRKA